MRSRRESIRCKGLLLFCISMIGLFALVSPQWVQCQQGAFPAKQIEVVVPFAPGRKPRCRDADFCGRPRQGAQGSRCDQEPGGGRRPHRGHDLLPRETGRIHDPCRLARGDHLQCPALEHPVLRPAEGFSACGVYRAQPHRDDGTQEIALPDIQRFPPVCQEEPRKAPGRGIGPRRGNPSSCSCRSSRIRKLIRS